MKKLSLILITLFSFSLLVNAQSSQNIFPDLIGENIESPASTSKQHHLELLNRSSMLKSANELVFLEDSIHGFSINAEMVWEGKYKIELTYDERGNLIGYLEKDWDDDAADFLIGYNDVWIYDENNKEVEYYYMKWNLVNIAWDTTVYETSFYDENGNLTEQIRKNWDANSSDWVNSSQRLYKYDENGLQIEYLYQKWDLANSVWYNNYLYETKYNTNGIRTEYYSQKWIVADSAWLNYSLNLYIYNDDNNVTESDLKRWDANLEDWVNNYFYTSTYGTNGLRAELLSQRWNASDSVYDNLSSYLFVYDEFGNETEYHSQSWDAGTSTWKQNKKDLNYYSQHDVTEAKILELGNSIIIYPNPAENEISISNIPELSTISVHDINGKLFIQREVDSNKTQLNVSELSPGLYILKISNSAGQQVSKFVKR